MSFKFSIGDRVKKKSGYLFEGIVRSRYEVPGGNRYDVQVHTEEAQATVITMAELDGWSKETEEQMLRWVNNCNGMIHIFAEEQLEKV